MIAHSKHVQKIISVSKWIITLFLGIFLSSMALAHTERAELIKIANEGLSYFLASASFNRNFINSLTVEQKILVNELSQILEESSAIRFYQDNKIQSFAMPDGWKNFAYVDLHEKVNVFLTTNTKAPELLLSNRREDFKNLKPGEPERFLKTTSDFSGSIYVNVLKLNEDPAMPFDLGRAHEPPPI